MRRRSPFPALMVVAGGFLAGLAAGLVVGLVRKKPASGYRPIHRATDGS